MNKALLVLSFGAFGFSASEYTILAVLSGAAQNLDIKPAMAGHFLSAYALGVVAGALLFAALLRNIPQKKTLLALTALFAIGNILTAISQDYIVMIITRFVAGLPQGGFFAVASLAAEQIAPKGKKAGAVAMMFSGMTVATLIGVPFFTFLSHIYSWRLPYAIIGILGFVMIYLIYRWVPILGTAVNTPLKQELSFIKSKQFWLLAGGVVLGNAGLFCWLSYISPFMIKLSDVPAKYMALVMAATGFGMMAGNYISGKLSENSPTIKVSIWVQALASIILALLFLFPNNPWITTILAMLCAGLMFALTVPEQMMMISAAPQGALLGSAVAQAAFYLGNTLGAFGGGLPLQNGFDYRYTALAGLVLSAAGLALLMLYGAKLKQNQLT